jgi:hypothetical protein
MRALRYIAGTEREWLHPEKYLVSTHWNKFGNGYLFMPEPREIHIVGETYIGYNDGRSEGWNEYGVRPSQKGFKDEKRQAEESKALRKFQAEWAEMHGPEFRGTSCYWGHRGHSGPHVTSDEYHRHLLEEARKYKRRP